MRPAPNRVSEGLLQELQPLWRYAMQLTRQPSDAEDLVQRTSLRALEQAEKYQPDGHHQLVAI